jgi:hypothetical protein
LLQLDKILKLLAPVKGGFEVASFEDGDFHGGFVLLSCTGGDVLLSEVVFEDFVPIRSGEGESHGGG